MANFSLGTCATLACLWEATAPKPGNVHRGADFEDLTFADFATSAAVIGPIIDAAPASTVGRTVLDAVRATRQAVGTNTNLGTLLLIAPLAAVASDQSLAAGIVDVLARLDQQDTADVYQAIREADAGGLGQVDEADVTSGDPPQLPLASVMRLAADRDLVARQYVNGFADVLTNVAPSVEQQLASGWPLADTIVHAHLQQMAAQPDSLIARKCGLEVAQQAADRAAEVLQCPAVSDLYQRRLGELDFWLRADGHRRNPGTTADLIAAALFVLLREGRLHWPVTFFRSSP